MTSIFLPYPAGQIHALRFGSGPELLIALHGFGNRAKMFAPLGEALSNQYTLVALDLPFHGLTEWTKVTFGKEDLLNIIHLVVQNEGKDRFSMMAFSFGARLAQAMLPGLTRCLNHLYLLSPDGVKTKYIAAAERTPPLIRHLLYHVLKKSNWFAHWIRLGHRIGWVSPFVYRFLVQNLSHPHRLRRVFGCWMAMYSFPLNHRNLKTILENSLVPTDVYIGLNDLMLSPKSLQKYYEGISNVRLHWLQSGHQLVNEQLIQAIKNDNLNHL